MNYKEYMKSDDWKNLKQIALKRARNKCECCWEKAFVVHHIRYPKLYPREDIENLLVLCKRCHALIHGIRKDIWKYFLCKLREDIWMLEKEVFNFFQYLIEIYYWKEKDIDSFFVSFSQNFPDQRMIFTKNLAEKYVGFFDIHKKDVVKNGR